ncbi:LysR family transcriptional regulator [Magnetococcus sp. PR-3]|uniref:LysR family transcriptional regulator n=1 Tax=Magnetococcus sp. PR-3 TaxID=3120355 RepID=UPI002FCDF3B5
MELLALKTFQAVVEEGGVLAASRRLNTVQSNVTSRIKRLEEEFGTPLFFRQGRGLTLSPSGKVLLEYSHQLLQLARQTSSALMQVGESCGQLRIGTKECFAAVHLPTILKHVKDHLPDLGLHVQSSPSVELIKQVLDHKMDCAFVGGPIEHPDLISHEIKKDHLVLIHTGQQNPEAQPLIMFREGCTYRARALTWQRENGHPLPQIMEMGTLEGILGCVAVGLGCTLVPRSVAQQSQHADTFTMTELPPEIANTTTLLIHHKQFPPLLGLQTLIDVAQKFHQ